MSFWSATRWRQHVALQHAADSAVMLVETSAGWELPVIEAEPSHPGDLTTLTAAMRERFGVDVAPLRCLAHSFDSASRMGEWVREVESETAGWAPSPPARWVTVDQLGHLKLARPGHRVILSSWLSGRVHTRLPWQRRGWRDRVVPWIETELRRRGFAGVDRVQ